MSDVTPEFKEASSRAAIRSLRELEQTAIMLEKWGPEAFPADENGQINFGRAMTDSAAQAIRDAWKAAIVEVEAFPQEPANLIEHYGKLRRALFEIVMTLAEGVTQSQDIPSPVMGHIRDAAQIAKDALKSKLVNADN